MGTLGCEPTGIVLNGKNRGNLQNCKAACEADSVCRAFNLMNGYFCEQLPHCNGGATKEVWFPKQNPSDIIQAWELATWHLLSTTHGCEPTATGAWLDGKNRGNLQNCKAACEENSDCRAFNLMNGYFCEQLSHCNGGATKPVWFPKQRPDDILQTWVLTSSEAI